jgi:hypothetical protein
MKNKTYKIKIAAISVLIIGLSSCNLDINIDPNNPSVATPAQLLPISQVRIANTLSEGSIGLSNGASECATNSV